MKKTLFLLAFIFSLTAFLFTACSKSIDEKTIQKYESQLNESIKQELSNLGENSGIKVEFSDFKCSGDKEFIVCLSPNFKTLAKDNEGEYQELFKAKNIKIRSNEVYQGEDKGTIGVKEYYNYFFKNQKNIQTSLVFENLQLGKKVLNDINASLSQQEAKMRSFVNDLALDSYTLSFENSLNKQEKDFMDRLDINFHSKNFNLSTNLSFDFKEDLLDFLDSQGVQFNTQTLAMDEKSISKLLSEDEGFANFNQALQENLILKDFVLNTKLKTQGVFDSYISLAKANLENLKAQSQNEEQALVLDNALNILNTMSKDEEYKLKIDLKFKNIALSQYGSAGINSIESLKINEQDSTEILKIIAPFFMLAMLMNSASF